MDKQELDAKIEEIAKALLSYCSARTSNYFEAEDKNPLKYAKSLTITQKVEVYHFFDYESDEEIHVKGFQDALANMKEAQNIGRQITYKSGYSNFTFDLWIKEDKVQVNFESGNMFHVVLNEDKEILSRGEAPLPFTVFQYGNLLITDEELLSDLAKVPKCNAILEADVSVLGAAVSDKKYERPANPALPLLGDAKTGVIVKFEMVEPEEDAMVMLAEILIGFIFQYGAPKEIRVSNVIVEAGLEQVCEVCGIKLRRVKRLPGLEEFKNSMCRFG